MRAIIFAILIGIFSCNTAEHENYADVDKHYEAKSGTYYPFHYHISQVTFHDFKFIYTIQNQNKLDSTVYILHSKDLSKRFGILWQLYIAKYYYKDGTAYKELVNAPIALGQKYLKLPDLNQNQLNINNPENWIQISRTNKNEKYYSDWCGKTLNKWNWNITTSSGITKTQSIDPSNCTGYPTLLQYSLIY